MPIITRTEFLRTKPPLTRKEQSGSRLWLALLAGTTSDNRNLLDAELSKHLPGVGPGSIDWRSPIAGDDFREYRDARFLKALDLLALQPKLVGGAKTPAGFWPARGPVWDALAVDSSGLRILVEAKAHIPEIVSMKGCSATAQPSIKLIRKRFDQVKTALRVSTQADWTGPLYQHANRISHLWWLRQQGVDAHLVFLYFLNADEVDGPTATASWEGAIKLEEKLLGLRKDHALRDYVHHVFFDITPLKP